MKKVILVFILITAFIVILKKAGTGSSKVSQDVKSSGKISVILTGFGSKDDGGNWHGEIAPFMKVLRDPRDVRSGVGMCENAYEGYLYDSKVLLVSTGMAKVRTTACLTEILHFYKNNVKEVVFSGISGITPAKGGMLDVEGKIKNSEPVMLGDVCINSIAYDLDLQYYSSDTVGSGKQEPLFWNQDSRFSSRYSVNDTSLAQELYKASEKVNWISPPQSVIDKNLQYHKVSRESKAWRPENCIEVTSDLFWNDIGMDRLGREKAAELLNQTYGSSLSSEDVLIVTSMEALPAGLVVGWWNSSGDQNVAYAYVRGAGNFDHTYLDQYGDAVVSGYDNLNSLTDPENGIYAIETASSVVLKMYELRSKMK